MKPSNLKDDKAKNPKEISKRENAKTVTSNASSQPDAKKMDEKRSEFSTSKSQEKKSDRDSGFPSSKKQ